MVQETVKGLNKLTKGTPIKVREYGDLGKVRISGGDFEPIIKDMGDVDDTGSGFIGATRLIKARVSVYKKLKRRQSIKERIKLNYPKGFPYR